MSDYMFMLESHLTGEQYRLVGQMQEAAASTGLSLYLTGGAMRDVLGGFPVRDLDFTVEGNPAKLVKVMTTKHGGVVVSTDEPKKSTQLRFEGGVTVEIAMARTERFAKSGARPTIEASAIHEDLRCRDFTVNSVALSLNKASLGLLVDPTNGVGDIERKELRAVHNYSFYDDPSRMLRLIRFKVRLGYVIDERTRLQYENAREAEMLTRISAEALGRELRNTGAEPDAHDVLAAFEQEKLIELYSPVLTGAKLNLPAFSKLQKARNMVPFGLDFRINTMALFLHVLFEKLNPKERAALIAAAELTKAETAAPEKMVSAAKKLERDLKSPKLQKASQLYALLSKTPGEQVLYLEVCSTQRIVHDRIRNYFQKYLPAALEVTNEVVAATGVAPGTPKFQRIKEEMIVTRLDARPKKVAPPPDPLPPPPPMSGFVRGSGMRQARS
jgi:tRNA nucleotidyltransferase (CCA-adding enzyme)